VFGTRHKLVFRIHSVNILVKMDEWTYTIRPFQGSLVRYRDNSNKRFLKKNSSIPYRIHENLLVCDKPFLARKSELSPWKKNLDEISQLQSYYSTALKIGINHFALLRFYSALKVPIFETTEQALTAISYLPNEKENYIKTCLIRTIVAAKLSKSFSKNGVIFIGASLPLGQMHAWIMENQNNPDKFDRNWINYHPLLALY